MVVLLAGLIVGCDLTEDYFITRKAAVERLKTVEQSVFQVSIVAVGGWPNGCGRFAGVEQSITGTNVNIVVFGKEPKGAVCTQALIEFDAPMTIRLPAAGEYAFHFWQSGSSSVDTTITVP